MEKERYEWSEPYADGVFDNDTGETWDALELVREQYKRIKELEAANKVLSNELTKNNIVKQDRLETCCGIPIYEIPTLKQSQNQKAVECFEKFKEFCKKEESPSFSETVAGYWFLSARKVFEYIDNQIEELKGEKINE